MVTESDAALMKTRMNAARNSLKFFTDIAQVRSSNNPFNRKRVADQVTLDYYRNADRKDTIVSAFNDAARTHVGNCDEKARICYSSLVGNPTLTGNSVATLVSAVKYDHAFVVMDHAALPAGEVGLSMLSHTAMIIDGWTEDWYFPNLSRHDALWRGLANLPNPRQLWVRKAIAAHQFTTKFIRSV
ncbi:hypothetical protein BH09PSE5_BH09PSE5_27330 [soil metagenome]